MPFSLDEWRETIFSISGFFASANKACGGNEADILRYGLHAIQQTILDHANRY